MEIIIFHSIPRLAAGLKEYIEIGRGSKSARRPYTIF